MRDLINFINFLSNNFIKVASPVYENDRSREFFKLKRELENFYGVNPDYPNRDIEQFKEQLEKVFRHNRLIMIQHPENPNKILMGLKNYGDLPPVIISNYFVRIIEEKKEGERTRFSAILVKGSPYYNHRF